MATDNFNGGTTGVTLATYSANWASPTGGGTCEIGPAGSGTQGARAEANASSFSVAYWNATFAEAHYSKANIYSPASAAGVAIRIQSGSNEFYYAVLSSNSTVYAGQLIGGVDTGWDGGVSGWSSGDVVELSIDPDTTTTVYLKRNGSTVATYTSKSALSGGRPGLAFYSTDTGNTADNWEGGDNGGAVGQPAMARHNGTPGMSRGASFGRGW